MRAKRLPRPKPALLQVSLAPSLLARLQRLARYERMTRNEMAAALLADAVLLADALDGCGRDREVKT